MGYCLLALSLRHLLRHTYPVTELRGDSQWGRRGLNSAKLSLCLVASNNTSDNDSRKPRRLHLFISRANQSTHKFGWHWEMGAQPLTCPGYIWMAFFFQSDSFFLLPQPLFLFVFKNHFYSTQHISLQLDRFIRDCTCELWSMQQIVIAAYATMPIKDSRWPPAQDGLSCGRLAFHSASYVLLFLLLLWYAQLIDRQQRPQFAALHQKSETMSSGAALRQRQINLAANKPGTESKMDAATESEPKSLSPKVPDRARVKCWRICQIEWSASKLVVSKIQKKKMLEILIMRVVSVLVVVNLVVVARSIIKSDHLSGGMEHERDLRSIWVFLFAFVAMSLLDSLLWVCISIS